MRLDLLGCPPYFLFLFLLLQYYFSCCFCLFWLFRKLLRECIYILQITRPTQIWTKVIHVKFSILSLIWCLFYFTFQLNKYFLKTLSWSLVCIHNSYILTTSERKFQQLPENSLLWKVPLRFLCLHIEIMDCINCSPNWILNLFLFCNISDILWIHSWSIT